MRFSKTIFILLVSIVIAVVFCNYKGDVWEQKVRQILYSVSNDSIPDYAKEYIDEKGVPYVYYSEQNGILAGQQYNATIVCNYALLYHQQIKNSNDSAFVKFKNCVDWLAVNMQRRDQVAFYEFTWQQPWYPSVGVPYTSGMTSGRAMEVFTYAAKTINDTSLLDNAKSLMRGFYISIDSGGFTYKSDNGWWYEELADVNMKTPKILDGHIFAITGVYQYWLSTKNDSALYIIQKGLQSLKHNLPLYDAGNGWSYYDIYQKRSDKKYHRILTDQMSQLYSITKDPFFLEYFNKWNSYFERPYVTRTIKEGNRTGWVLIALCSLISFLTLWLISNLLKGFKPKKPD